MTPSLGLDRSLAVASTTSCPAAGPCAPRCCEQEVVTVLVIGIDAHKRTHALVAADAVGRPVGQRTVPATPEGHQDAVAWARQWPDRRFALEDWRTLTRRLESNLLCAGHRVESVPTKLMAGARRGGRERRKPDPFDALAVARASLREPTLPVAVLDDASRELRLDTACCPLRLGLMPNYVGSAVGKSATRPTVGRKKCL